MMSIKLKKSLLTNEEMKELRYGKNVNKFISDIDIRKKCIHFDENGTDMVMQKKDGNDIVYCPICGAEWDCKYIAKDELKSNIKVITDSIELIKWIGDLDNDVMLELARIQDRLDKLPDLYEYTINNFKRYFDKSENVTDPFQNNRIGLAPEGVYNSPYMMGRNVLYGTNLDSYNPIHVLIKDYIGKKVSEISDWYKPIKYINTETRKNISYKTAQYKTVTDAYIDQEDHMTIIIECK